MATINNNQEIAPDDKQPTADKKQGNENKTPANPETDTGPDEFIGPNADTDLPIDGQIINDAVLRGEPHNEDNAINGPLDNKDTTK